MQIIYTNKLYYAEVRIVYIMITAFRGYREDRLARPAEERVSNLVNTILKNWTNAIYKHV